MSPADADEVPWLDDREQAAWRSYLDLRDEIALTEVQRPKQERRRAERQQGRLYRQIKALKRERR